MYQMCKVLQVFYNVITVLFIMVFRTVIAEKLRQNTQYAKAH